MDVKNKDIALSEEYAVEPEVTDSGAKNKPDLEKLRLYKQTKLLLAGQLRILREGLIVMGRDSSEQECAELMVKLAEDRFTLAVVGQFKRGKSSLMNAIIGRDLLPTGVLPLTSAITVLKYGPTEHLIVHREDSIFPYDLPVTALSDYVTEKGNPGNEKKVKAVYVELPVPFLRCGIEFVDTPGVGSAITANTKTTYDFLPKCDAVLFVTSVDTPMTSLELDFLKEIREYVNKIFFIVNKTDLLKEDELEDVLKFVIETIRSQVGNSDLKVFPVSARLGGLARTSGNPILYEQSGIKTLEQALASFLSEEKSTVFLAALIHKALKILEEESSAFRDSNLLARIKDVQREKSVTVKRDPYAAAAAAFKAQAKLKELYDRVLSHGTQDITDITTPQTEPVAEKEVNMIANGEINIKADLRTRGCPVCHHVSRLVLDFFAHWQYQLSTEEEVQAKFAEESGFCPLHTWQLLALSSPHGASIGYAQLAEKTSNRLKEKTATYIKGDTLRQLVPDSRNCRVCKLIQTAEEEYIQKLADIINGADGKNQYSSSQGVCLRHLGMLINNVALHPENQEFLLSHAAQRFEEDAEDMRSYAMKHEALRRSLQNRDEKDAYLRAIIRMVGHRNLCMPYNEEMDI